MTERHRSWASIGVLLGLCVPVSSAAAANRYVGKPGRDVENACLDPTRPCKTISRAVSQAPSGDVINVAGERVKYRDNVHVEGSVTLTFLGGWDRAFTARDTVLRPSIVDGRKRGRVWTLEAEAGDSLTVQIDGFLLRKGRVPAKKNPDPYNYGGGLAAIAESGTLSLTLANSIVTRSSVLDGPLAYGEMGGGVALDASASGTIQATLDHVSVIECSAPQGGGIGVTASTDGTVQATLRDVTLADNTAGIGGGLSAYTYVNDGHAPGTVALGLANTVIIDNRATWGGGGLFTNAGYGGGALTLDVDSSTIAQNRSLASSPTFAGGGVVLLAQATTLSASFRNAIVWGNTSTFDVGGHDLLFIEAEAGTVAASADHSDIGEFQGFGTLVADLGGNVNVDPKLAAGRLVAASPVIDAGTCVGQPALDIDGQARPTGAGCDVGADEFVP